MQVLHNNKVKSERWKLKEGGGSFLGDFVLKKGKNY